MSQPFQLLESAELTTETEPAEAWKAAGGAGREESLVIQTSFLGDVVLTTPLLAELALRGPVDVVVTPAAAPLLARHKSIRNLYQYDKRGADSGLGGLWRLAKALRGRRSPMRGSRFTERRARRVAYLAQGSVRSATLAMLAGCDERVGFATAAGRLLYTRRVAFRDDVHHAERLWRLGVADGPSGKVDADTLRPRLYPSIEDVAAVDALLAAGGVAGPYVVLAPGSVWATKRWPHYAQLAAEIAGRMPVVIAGGPGDAEQAREIVAASPRGRAVDATGRLGLLASAELVRRAQALVTNDSLPQHLASAMGTPTVTVFGPTVPTFGFGPLAPRSASVGLESLPCRPCHHHGPPRCPLGHWRCMRDLDVARVAAAARGAVREG